MMTETLYELVKSCLGVLYNDDSSLVEFKFLLVK